VPGNSPSADAKNALGIEARRHRLKLRQSDLGGRIGAVGPGRSKARGAPFRTVTELMATSLPVDDLPGALRNFAGRNAFRAPTVAGAAELFKTAAPLGAEVLLQPFP